MTGAYWYGLPEPDANPKRPSELFTLVEQHPSTRNEGHAEEPPRPRLLRADTGGGSPDPLFEQGWDAALRSSIASDSYLPKLASTLGVSEDFDDAVEDLELTLFQLSQLDVAQEAETKRVVSVTGLVNYAQCPKRFFWSEIDPLPRRRNPAAVAGTELHRRIELHQRGQVPFESLEPGLYDVPDEAAGDGGFRAFVDSAYGSEPAELVEAPFTVTLDTGYRVRGRIDAVYRRNDEWEIVDFKSGRPREDPSLMVQLQAYAVAADEVDFGVERPNQISVSFVYLGGGLQVVSHRTDAAWRDDARNRLESLTEGIESRDFEPAPGEWCHRCDFLRFCEPGRRMVASEG